MKTLLLLACAVAAGGCAAIGVPFTGEPSVQRIVSEDDQVRIDELRVRGQTRRLSVQPKAASAPGYEIVPQASPQDPSQNKDAAGQRVWPLLSF